MGKDLLTRLLRWLRIRSDPNSVERITPQELKQRLNRGDHIEILDVRHWRDVVASGEKLPGARWVDRAKIDSEVAPNHTYVLYCS